MPIVPFRPRGVWSEQRLKPFNSERLMKPDLTQEMPARPPDFLISNLVLPTKTPPKSIKKLMIITQKSSYNSQLGFFHWLTSAQARRSPSLENAFGVLKSKHAAVELLRETRIEVGITVMWLGTTLNLPNKQSQRPWLSPAFPAWPPRFSTRVFLQTQRGGEEELGSLSVQLYNTAKGTDSVSSQPEICFILRANNRQLLAR